jgi:hypothetical protein
MAMFLGWHHSVPPSMMAVGRVGGGVYGLFFAVVAAAACAAFAAARCFCFSA